MPNCFSIKVKFSYYPIDLMNLSECNVPISVGIRRVTVTARKSRKSSTPVLMLHTVTSSPTILCSIEARLIRSSSTSLSMSVIISLPKIFSGKQAVTPKKAAMSHIRPRLIFCARLSS